MTGYIAPVSAYLLLLLGLFCLPFPANCFSRHNPIHTIPSPTWRVKVTLDTGSYNGDMLLCFLAPASSVRRGGRVITYGERWLRCRSRIPLNCRLVNKARLGSYFQFGLEWIPKLLSVRGWGGSTQSFSLPSRVSNGKSFQQRAVALKLNSNTNKVVRGRARKLRARSHQRRHTAGCLQRYDQTFLSFLFFPYAD